MSIQNADLSAIHSFINANDAQLKQIARQDAKREFRNDPQRKREDKFASMLPVADSLIQGAATKGTIGKKAKVAAKAGTDWLIFLGATKIYNHIANKVVDTFPGLKEFAEENPVTATVANTSLGAVTGLSAIYYVNKAWSAFAKTKIGAPIQKGITKIYNLLDDSNTGKTINEGMSALATKFPKATNRLRTVAKWALPVAAIGVVGVFLYDLIKMSNKKDANFDKLKEMQNQLTKEVANANLSSVNGKIIDVEVQ